MQKSSDVSPLCIYHRVHWAAASWAPPPHVASYGIRNTEPSRDASRLQITRCCMPADNPPFPHILVTNGSGFAHVQFSGQVVLSSSTFPSALTASNRSINQRPWDDPCPRARRCTPHSNYSLQDVHCRSECASSHRSAPRLCLCKRAAPDLGLCRHHGRIDAWFA